MSRNSAIVLAATVAIGAVTGLSTSASARSYHPKATAHHVVRSHFSGPTVTRSHIAYAVRPVYRQIRSRPTAFHSGMQTARLGSTKYRPIPGLGDKVTAKATTPSATDLKDSGSGRHHEGTATARAEAGECRRQVQAEDHADEHHDPERSDSSGDSGQADRSVDHDWTDQ